MIRKGERVETARPICVLCRKLGPPGHKDCVCVRCRAQLDSDRVAFLEEIAWAKSMAEARYVRAGGAR